jgi:O-antigen ligase
VAVFLYLLFNLPWKKSVRIISYAIGFVSIIIILTGVLLPSAYDLVGERASSIIHPTEEVASTNRFNLLSPIFNKIKEHSLIGSGFGTTVEYESVVPEKYGTLRVFAFEWSYLDTILEIGIIGLSIYLLLMLKTFKVGIKRIVSGNDKIMIVGLLASLFGLIVTNITTPYLNHPLGIGFLLLVMVILSII